MRKTLRLLIAIIGIVAMIEPAQGAEKKRRRIMQNANDPYVVFVPGQPLLFVAERGRSVVYLRYPELVVDRKLETPANRRLDVIKASPDGTWIAGFFEQSNIGMGGELRVWKLATGETRLLLDDASRAFAFMDDHRLVVWQPKSGITQWDLGEPEARRFGPVITAAERVQVNVGCKGLYLSPDARYLLICGTCRGGDANSKTDWWDYCLYDLSDGATVGWAENPDPMGATIPTWWRQNGQERMGDYKFSRQFSELLIGTNIGSPADEGYGCRKAGENRELCFNVGGVSMIEVTPPTGVEPPPPPPPSAALVQKEAPAPRRGNKFSDIVSDLKARVQAETNAGRGEAAAARARRAAHEPTRRTLWTIPASDEIGGRLINSCAQSADGRWIAVTAMGVMVSLFDTEHLESNEDGDGQKPTMVQQLELP